MEPATNKKTAGYIGIGVIALGAFFIGYLLYPQLHKIPVEEHMMSDGSMMHDRTNDSMATHMSMNQMMSAMTDGLTGKSGDEFDAAFLEEMIPHHMGAIEMARMVLASSKRPELIKMANDIIKAQQSEVDTMRGWQRAWFGIQAQ